MLRSLLLLAPTLSLFACAGLEPGDPRADAGCDIRRTTCEQQCRESGSKTGGATDLSACYQACQPPRDGTVCRP